MIPISRRWVGTSVTSAPSMRMSPCSGFRNPATRLSSVVLPKRDELAAADLQRHIVERDNLAEALGDAVERDGDILAARPPRYRIGRSAGWPVSGDAQRSALLRDRGRHWRRSEASRLPQYT